jgi:UDP-N-acetylglucosamine/UDP-N-acetylgalactosamine diphosphorylase
MRTWKEICAEAEKYGQGHLLEHASQLLPEQRDQYRSELGRLDFARLRELFVKASDSICPLDFNRIEAPVILRAPRTEAEVAREKEARHIGESALRQGKIAIILVAGGQGTRLGHPGPKGTYPIGPVTGRSLFQIHAEKVLALSRKYQTDLPLLIMTSQENDRDTKAFFENAGYFGLKPEQVNFFVQGMLPALDSETGRVLLKAPGELALSPNGHGGVIKALDESDCLRLMADRGVTDFFYYQVDNPLVKVAEPVFLGHHLLARAEMSLKVLAKLYPTERLGNLVTYQGRMQIVEYTELPDWLAEQRNEDGELRIWAGSPAIHVFNLQFLQRLAKGTLQLPYHIARKAVPYLDAQGNIVKPAQPNALKFEMFVFDALPLAERAVALETSRFEEFEPLKNVNGENSAQSVRQALSDNYGQWLERAGSKISRDEEGHVTAPIEISPLVALEGDDLLGKTVPSLVANQSVVL